MSRQSLSGGEHQDPLRSGAIFRMNIPRSSPLSKVDPISASHGSTSSVERQQVQNTFDEIYRATPVPSFLKKMSTASSKDAITDRSASTSHPTTASANKYDSAAVTAAPMPPPAQFPSYVLQAPSPVISSTSNSPLVLGLPQNGHELYVAAAVNGFPYLLSSAPPIQLGHQSPIAALAVQQPQQVQMASTVLSPQLHHFYQQPQRIQSEGKELEKNLSPEPQQLSEVPRQEKKLEGRQLHLQRSSPVTAVGDGDCAPGEEEVTGIYGTKFSSDTIHSNEESHTYSKEYMREEKLTENETEQNIVRNVRRRTSLSKKNRIAPSQCAEARFRRAAVGSRSASAGADSLLGLSGVLQPAASRGGVAIEGSCNHDDGRQLYRAARGAPDAKQPLTKKYNDEKAREDRLQEQSSKVIQGAQKKIDVQGGDKTLEAKKDEVEGRMSNKSPALTTRDSWKRKAAPVEIDPSHEKISAVAMKHPSDELSGANSSIVRTRSGRRVIQKHLKTNESSEDSADDAQESKRKKKNSRVDSKSSPNKSQAIDHELLKKDVMKDGREWKSSEIIALYAVQSKIPIKAVDFWDQVSDALMDRGVFRSSDECKQRWFASLKEAEKRREKHQEAKRKHQEQQLLASKDHLEPSSSAGVAEKRRRVTKNQLKVLAKNSSKALHPDDIFKSQQLVVKQQSLGANENEAERTAAAASADSQCDEVATDDFNQGCTHGSAAAQRTLVQSITSQSPADVATMSNMKTSIVDDSDEEEAAAAANGLVSFDKSTHVHKLNIRGNKIPKRSSLPNGRPQQKNSTKNEGKHDAAPAGQLENNRPHATASGYSRFSSLFNSKEGRVNEAVLRQQSKALLQEQRSVDGTGSRLTAGVVPGSSDEEEDDDSDSSNDAGDTAFMNW